MHKLTRRKADVYHRAALCPTIFKFHHHLRTTHHDTTMLLPDPSAPTAIPATTITAAATTITAAATPSSSTMDSPADVPTKRQKVHGERTGEKAQYRTLRKGDGKLPKKKYYRQRAHANPFSDHNLA